METERDAIIRSSGRRTPSFHNRSFKKLLEFDAKSGIESWNKSLTALKQIAMPKITSLKMLMQKENEVNPVIDASSRGSIKRGSITRGSIVRRRSKPKKESISSARNLRESRSGSPQRPENAESDSSTEKSPYSSIARSVKTSRLSQFRANSNTIKVINLQRADGSHLQKLVPLDFSALKRRETYNEFRKELNNIDAIRYLPLESAFKKLTMKSSTANNKSEIQRKELTADEVYDNIIEAKKKRIEQQREKNAKKSHSLSKLARVNSLKDNTLLLKSTISVKQDSMTMMPMDTSSIWNNSSSNEKQLSIMSSSILRSKNLNKSISDSKPFGPLKTLRTLDDSNSRIYKKCTSIKPGEQSARKAIENIMKTNETFTTFKRAVNDIYTVLSSREAEKADSLDFWKGVAPEITNTKRLRKVELKDNFLSMINEVQQEIDKAKILNRI